MRRLSVFIAASLFLAGCSPSESTAPPVPDAAPVTPDPSAAALSSLPPGATMSTTTTSTTLRPPTPTDPPAIEAPTIGDLEIPCRGTGTAPLDDRPGVSDDALTIGTGTDRGGIATTRSGRGALDMVDALADHCNALGGLLGRDVRVREYDAAGVEATDRVTTACAEVVALVGNAFHQEFEAVVAAEPCALPVYPIGVGLVPTDPFPIHGHVAALFADPATAAGIVLVGPDTISDAFARADRRAAIGLSGGVLSVVDEVAYPIDRAPDWDRVVSEARRAGAGQVHLSGGCAEAVVPFLAAAADAGWEPVVLTTARAYDDACLAVGNPGRFLVELPFLPFEDGDAAPATMAHAELLDAIGAPRTGEGILAASAFWRWALDALTCLPDGDGACVAAAAARPDDWTAGGLHPAIAADGTSAGCAVVLGVEGGAFVRRLPVEPGEYDCTPELSVRLP